MNDVVFLLHHNKSGDSPEPGLLATLFGYSIMWIDLEGDMPAGPTVFTSLDDALADPRWLRWTWIFVDATASDDLSKFGHQDKTVYVFGDEVEGWNRSTDQLPGALLHVDTDLPRGTEHTVALCVEAIIVHRFYQVDT